MQSELFLLGDFAAMEPPVPFQLAAAT